MYLINNHNGGQHGFNAVVLRAALADGSLRAAQQEAAARIETTAKALAAQHRKTGNLEASIKTRKRNKADLEVVMTDKAAWHIEFGHESPNGDWVEGLHIMRDATLANGGIVRFP